ncbi:SpvB/TcaC N-terminal domain-containing protein [Microbulbifer sp. S227A]|uniref:SpvB/TcaC N-terminal domain-containing protein n=1 Tax=Microbulbifer sp. S227A TaxID=3415131 RepID=UPI003C7D9F32
MSETGPVSSPMEADANGGLPSRFDLPDTTLPQGGGAIRGLDERFAVNGANGTATFTVPLPVSPARGGEPALALSYSSAGGNGPFGQGWSVDIPSISRRTDRGLPRYRDAVDSDTYVLAGLEDLVPARDGAGALIETTRRDEAGQTHRVRRYRPRIEGSFSRIERWDHTASGQVHWRVITRDNVTSVYGERAAARLADPEAPAHVFRWMCERRFDDRGNLTLYDYKAEDGAGLNIPPAERDRAGGATQIYPKRILYGNRAPYAPGDPLPGEDAFRFQTVFDYGEHDDAPFSDLGLGQLAYAADPRPVENGAWATRPDRFSSYRSGFDIRTNRRCRRVMLFHLFDAPELVRSVDLDYDDATGLSLLSGATTRGYIRDGAGYTARAMPGLRFRYAGHAWQTGQRGLSPGDLAGLRAGLADDARLFVDLYGEGLPGMLTRDAAGWHYARNRGSGAFEAQAVIDPLPALATRAGNLVDLGADGRQRLASRDARPRGQYTMQQDETWSAFATIPATLTTPVDLPDARPVDLTGDGRPDLLITGGESLLWYESKGLDGHAPARVVELLDAESRNPRVVFSDPEQSVVLADMTGDGLSDIVRVRNGAICYWPNRGYGRFGRRIDMDNAPLLDAPDRFDPARLRFADIDGSGPADLVYLTDRARIWRNLWGNGWIEAPVEITGLPHHAEARIETVDIYGQGTTCLAWSSGLPADAHAPLRVIDLMAGRKPFLMTGYSNGSGADVTVEYRHSTAFYLADRAEGRPWLSRLPFPVHLVSRLETRDLVAETSRVETFSYHHGHYDTAEREFRGFARVDRRDAETASHFAAQEGGGSVPAPLDQAPVLTRTWYHTGGGPDARQLLQGLRGEFYRDPVNPEPLLPPVDLPTTPDAEEARAAARTLKGKTLRQEVYAEDGTARAAIPLTIANTRHRVHRVQRRAGNAPPVMFSTAIETLTLHVEQGLSEPRLSHTLTLAEDAHGNPLRSANVVYPRAGPDPAVPPEVQAEQARLCISSQQTVYSNAFDTETAYRLPIAVEEHSWEIAGVSPARDLFAVGELDAAITAATEIPFETPFSGAAERRVIAAMRTGFWDDSGTVALPHGVIAANALPRQSQALAFTPGLLGAVYGADVDAAMMSAAGYVAIDGGWWRPTSTVRYDRFSQPVSVETPFGDMASLTRDADDLMVESRSDFVGNLSRFVNDTRTLSPVEKVSPNQNRTQIRMDELGFVVAVARLGKGAEGDTLADPTVRHSYDLGVFAATGRPNVVRTERRERHGPGSPVRLSVEYTNGAGGVQMAKREAEPGLARMRGAGGVVEVDTSPALRWVASGRIVQNNKGNPIKTYEPYFSTSPDYESEQDLVQVGVSAIRHYDALGREIRTDHPDGTFERIGFTPWLILRHDRNDTVLDSDWYAARGAPDPLLDPEPEAAEPRAAWLAAAHADTPTREHFDTLGRSVVTETDAGGGVTHQLRTIIDISGRSRAVIDARGNSIMRYDHALTGERIAQDSPDAGARRLLPDVLGRVILGWDSRGHRTRTEYDALDRPLRVWLRAGAGLEMLVSRLDYGDGPDAPADAVARNLRTRLVRRFDQAGLLAQEAFDLNGNLTRVARRLATATTGTIDYDRPDPLALLEAETFLSETAYDALSRPTRISTPASAGMVASVITPGYNAGQAVERIALAVRGGASRDCITNIDYDAHGRRLAVDYANGTRREQSFDALSFRLRRQLTRRGATVLQDLGYTYDPVGNVTEIRDAAAADVYFAGAVVGARRRFRYSALYRLLRASGREHVGQNRPPGAGDPTRSGLAHPGDGAAMRSYVQDYDYDAAGNLLEIVHRAGVGAFAEQWRQTATYDAGSNRMIDVTAAGVTETFAHDGHGNMGFPHLDLAEWDHNDRLRRVVRATAEARYCYDADGVRIRKTELRGSVREERLYLGGFELFRRHNAGRLELERETVHLMDGESRFALAETAATGTVDAGGTLMRYQYHDHLGSAALELDAGGAVISYEEYHPFGTTSYQAGRDATETRRKTYRYVATEQDDLTGFYHMGARYYAPWLGRWSACDPAGLVDGPNLYRYARNNPLRMSDRQGTDPDDEVEVGPLRLRNIRIDVSGGIGTPPGGVPMFLPPRPGPRLQFSSSLSLAPMPPSLPRDVPAPDALPPPRSGDAEDAGDGDSGTPVRAEASAVITSDAQSGTITASTEAFGLVGTIGSGVWASLHATGTFTAPTPDSSSLDPYLFARHATGQGRFFGAVQVPGLTLGTYSGDFTLRPHGQFGFNADIGTIGNLARLNLDGSGQLRDGGVDLQATGQLRLFGYPQLRLDVEGSIESTGEYSFTGGAQGLIFPTPLPIPTTYAFGSFSASSAEGFSGQAHLIGLGPFIPFPDVPDPAPLPPAARDLINPPADPSIRPLVLGYGFFDYRQGRFSGVTVGGVLFEDSREGGNPIGVPGLGGSAVVAF